MPIASASSVASARALHFAIFFGNGKIAPWCIRLHYICYSASAYMFHFKIYLLLFFSFDVVARELNFSFPTVNKKGIRGRSSKAASIDGRMIVALQSASVHSW
jgi:hypothetical protein